MELVREIWPFVSFALFSAVLFQAIKSTIFLPKNMRSKRKYVLLFIKKTFPIYPPLLGILVGLIPNIPTSSFVQETQAARSLYFAAAGISSTWVFDLVKTFFKTRVRSIFSE